MEEITWAGLRQKCLGDISRNGVNSRCWHTPEVRCGSVVLQLPQTLLSYWMKQESVQHPTTPEISTTGTTVPLLSQSLFRGTNACSSNSWCWSLSSFNDLSCDRATGWNRKHFRFWFRFGCSGCRGYEIYEKWLTGSSQGRMLAYSDNQNKYRE